MELKQKLSLIKSITDAICEAWENGYYTEFEMNHTSINYMEIRSWCGLNQDPDLDNNPDEIWIDDQIEIIYKQIINSIK